MRILSEDIFDFSEELHFSLSQKMQWLAYDSSLESVTARDIDLFESLEEATEYKKEKESVGETFQLLPIEATSSKIDELIIQALHETDEYPDVELDVSELLNTPEQLNFNYTAECLEELMDGFDWSTVFYDPLEANTEAESLENTNEFNRLEFLLSEMKQFRESGPVAAALVKRLVKDYWRGTPMESQISDFVKEPEQYEVAESVSHVNESSKVISDEVLELAEMAMSRGEHWMAYNGALYFIDKSDVHFFKTPDEANEFAHYNIKDRDHFNVIEIHSVADILKRIPYGKELSEQLDFDRIPLHNKEENAFTDTLIDHFEQTSILNYKNQFMNENNLKYLKDNLKYTGFGEALFGELEKSIKEQKPEFQLHFTTQINNRPFNATLHFGRSENSDMYFFNSYQASIDKKNGEKVGQSFRLYKGKGVTAKEAYNLLQGRAVFKELTNKEDQPYKAWIQLDFENKDKYENHVVKQYHEKYGYDVAASVAKFPVLEMDSGKKQEDLLKSLEKGNTQSVTMEINGQAEKMFLEANPQYKTVNVYNSELKLMKHEELPMTNSKDMKQDVSQGNRLEQSASQEIKQDNKPEVKQGQKPVASQKSNDSLLPKKRTGKKNKVRI